MEKIKLENVQYKIDGDEFSCWENGSIELQSFIEYWERNKDSWDAETRCRNLAELCKIEGFEEWYNEEKIPTFYDCFKAHCHANFGKSFDQRVFDKLSKDQKKEFLQELKANVRIHQ